MTAIPSNNHPALTLKLARGGKLAAGLEIIDVTTGKRAALIPDGELAAIVEALVLAAPDLLWANLRASAHLHQSADETSEKRKLCRLLSDAVRRATQLSSE